MMSSADVTLLTIVTTLCCLTRPALASPLPPSLPRLEQELDSLIPHSPPQEFSVEDTQNLEDSPPSPSHQEALRDVLQDDQDLSNGKEQHPSEKSLPPQTRLGTSDDSLAGSVVGISDKPADSNEAIPDDDVAEEDEVEEEVESPPLVLEEAELNERDQEEELQLLSSKNRYGSEIQFRGSSTSGENDPKPHDPKRDDLNQELQGHIPVVENSKDHSEEPNYLHKTGKEEQMEDSDQLVRDDQEEELKTLQRQINEDLGEGGGGGGGEEEEGKGGGGGGRGDEEQEEEEAKEEVGGKEGREIGGTEDDDDEEEEEEEEEELDDLKRLPLSESKEDHENDAASRELDSTTSHARTDGSLAGDVYDGHISPGNDDDSDPDLWMKKVKDRNPDQFSPTELVLSGKSSDMLQHPDSSHPGYLWRWDDRGPSRYNFDDVIAGGEAGETKVKRGRGMEEEDEGEEEERRFRPVRVIVLNETLYLNSTKDDLLPKFQPVPMPDKFEDYDVNRDGVISLPELRYVSRATEGVREAFRDADSDGDGWLDPREFLNTGWGIPLDSPPPPPLPPGTQRGIRENVPPAS